MNVRKLIEQLEKLPGDMEIILQKDSEGNGYSPLDCIDSECIYTPENEWSGEVGVKETYLEYCACNGDSPSEAQERWDKKEKCVVLCPTN